MEQPVVMPQDPSTSLGMTKKRAAQTLIDTVASSPVHFAGNAMKPFLKALSRESCLNRPAEPIR